jgi:protein-S-isoprenylcysteine O-methyltransferase Ste14
MGKFLFKYRSFIPIPYFLFLLIVIEFNLLNFFVGSFIILFGLSIRFFSQGFAGDWMRGNEITADYILDKGLYSIIRHPLYAGNFFVGFGFTLLSGFYPVFLLPIYSFVFFVYYYLIVREEEKYLNKKFGEKFLSYREKTPAVFPAFKRWNEGMFSIQHALKLEISTYLTTVSICVSLLMKSLFF